MADRSMLTFDRDGARFTYRVVAVVLDGDRVLLHRAERDDFWALPGGRAELLEPAATGLRREMREELGVEVRVGRLLYVAENFFAHAGKAWHELGLYFLVNLPPDSSLLGRAEPFDGWEEGGIRLIFRWFPLDELPRARLYPSFLREGLRALPAVPTHIVHTGTED